MEMRSKKCTKDVCPDLKSFSMQRSMYVPNYLLLPQFAVSGPFWALNSSTRSMFPFDDVVMIQHTDVSWPSWEMILDFGHRLIFLILATFRLCESGQICDFRAFSWEHNKEWPQIWHVGVFWPPSEQIRFWSRYVDFWNAWEEWPKIWHVDVSWPPLELITFGSWSTDFPHFGAIFT